VLALDSVQLGARRRPVVPDEADLRDAERARRIRASATGSSSGPRRRSRSPTGGRGRHAPGRGRRHPRREVIGERMMLDPTKLYEQQRFWEADEGGHLSRTDLPRVVGARMLADLAVMYPDKRAELAAPRTGVLAWISDKPQPHANGLRFLAGIKSKKALEKMRDWAFPKDELPKEGQQPPFPPAFETAQSAPPLHRHDEGRRELPEAPRPVQAQEGPEDGHHAGGPPGGRPRDARDGAPRGDVRRVAGPRALRRPEGRRDDDEVHRGRDLARGGPPGRVRGDRLVRRRQADGRDREEGGEYAASRSRASSSSARVTRPRSR
jgi:hypothetical protein